ncbi:MAG: hypothetical protein GF313_11700 [Caldithrix sp.]|nr:hypothetical protein [Caldithrix sp.]
MKSKCLLNLPKVLIFALFIIIIIGSLKSLQAEREQIVYRTNYKFVYDNQDELLVKTLIENLHGHVDRLEHFFGRKPHSMITIVIAKSDQVFQQFTPDHIPEWSQAVANWRKRYIVVRLDRPEAVKQLPRILTHELSHIFIVGNNLDNIPTWLHEGIAKFVSNDPPSLTEKVALANAFSRNNVMQLSALDSMLAFNAAKARLAYTQSWTAVDYFVTQHGLTGMQRLIGNIGMYHSLNDAFINTVGYDFIDFEIRWYEHTANRYRWLILLNFEHILWILMGLLAILAIITVQIRNRKKLRQWQMDEENDLLYPE